VTHLCLIRLDFGNSDLPFDTAQGGESFHSAQDRESFDPAQDRESFDPAQDREPVERPVDRPAERLVEPFRISTRPPRPSASAEASRCRAGLSESDGGQVFGFRIYQRLAFALGC
jgi:hypothetical protein